MEKGSNVEGEPPSSSCDVFQICDSFQFYFSFLIYSLHEDSDDVGVKLGEFDCSYQA